MTTFSISSVLEKMSNRDKDFRYMALSDLLNELKKDTFKMDNDSEKKICTAMVQLFDDPSGDVQGMAVKCLEPLISKIKEAQLQVIIDTLSDYVLQNKKSELRDIAGIGLRTVVAQTPPESPTATIVIQRVNPKLIQGVSQDIPEVVMECLSVLSDVLRRYPTLVQEHEKIQKAIVPHLTSTRDASRKKAISCLGYWSVSAPDNLFSDLVTYLLNEIQSAKKANYIRTLISVIGAISRSVGYRLGKFLESKGIIGLLVKYLHDERFQSDDELKENTFQTFESLVLRCPSEVRPFIDEILAQALEFIKWDPNYDAVSDEEEEEEGGEDDEEEEEPSDDEDYSDDDDMSWKVRRAAAKCIDAVVVTRPDLLEKLYKMVVPAIVARFKEREENVKLDIFGVFIDVLKQTTLVSRGSRNTEEGVLAQLKSNIPAAMGNLNKELKSKAVKAKSRTGIFQLLKELVHTYPGALNEHIGDAVVGITTSLSGKGTDASTKMEGLTFARLLLTSHDAAVFHPHIKALSAPVLKAVGDNYYKITAEALRVTSHLVTVIRPHNGAASQFDHKPYAQKIYDSIFEKYNAQDIDQEVKESAITCMGLTVAHLGDGLSADSLKKALDILLQRLSNEITRLTSVNALIEIANSPLKVDIRAILPEALTELAAFLRQANRQLKQASLRALAVLVKSYGADIKSQQYEAVLNESVNLISDVDLHLTHLALRLLETVISVDKDSINVVQAKLYPHILALVQSPVLQGLALESLLALYSALVAADHKKFGFQELLDSLLGLSLKASQTTKQSQANIAKCIAALCVNATADQRKATVERFIADVRKAGTSRVLALLALGEIGRRVDLSAHTDIQSVLLDAFDGGEDEKSAASFALGNVAVGNVERFLPFVLAQIKETPKKQYLLMHSLEEIISHSTGAAAATALLPHLTEVLALLFQHADKDEEGIRTVVAKCLGKFTLISPDQLVPALQKKIGDASPQTRVSVITAIKYAVDPHPHPVDAALATIIPQVLAGLSDPEVEVRRAALLTLNYAAHNKANLVRPVLSEHLNALYAETLVKKELIKVIDLGPFKHKVDEGLENRKAAFECLYTLLDTSIDKLDIPALIKHLVEGLQDIHDIQLLCHLMLVRLAQHAPTALLTGVELLIEPLRKTVTSKVKDNSVKQQVDRNEELIRSALRAIAAISRIPDIETAVKFDEFVKQTVKTGPYAEQFDNIVKETAPKTSSD